MDVIMLRKNSLFILVALLLCIVVSCSSNGENEKDPIEVEYLKKRDFMAACYCKVYGFSSPTFKKKLIREFGMSMENLRDNRFQKGVFIVTDSSKYKHIFNLNYPDTSNSSPLKNFYASFNLLVDCFNRDSIYIGSITVNDQCKCFNTNGRFQESLLDEIKPVFPEWYDSYVRECRKTP
jgi:hypothetical protein